MSDHAFQFSTGRKAEITELNGLEQFKADKACESSETLPIMYFRAAAALTKLGDEEFARAFDPVSINARLQKLKGRESDELVREYNTAFTAFTPDELEKSSAGGDSQLNSSL